MVDEQVAPAGGAVERDAALELLAEASGQRRITLGADRGYDARSFVKGCRKMAVTPRAAQKQRSAIDRRTTRYEGHRVSRRARKRTEEVFGWVKTVSGGRKLRYCGGGLQPFLDGNDHRQLQPGAAGQTDDGGGVSRGIALSRKPPTTPRIFRSDQARTINHPSITANHPPTPQFGVPSSLSCHAAPAHFSTRLGTSSASRRVFVAPGRAVGQHATDIVSAEASRLSGRRRVSRQGS